MKKQDTYQSIQLYLNHSPKPHPGFPGGSAVKNLLAKQETLVHRLQWLRSQALTTAPIVMKHELSCSVARGIFPDQGSNLCLLHSLSTREALAVSGLSCILQDLYLWCTDSLVAMCRLSCPVTCGILVPWPGIESASSALQGGFSTTGPPGKSQITYIFKSHFSGVPLTLNRVI